MSSFFSYFDRKWVLTIQDSKTKEELFSLNRSSTETARKNEYGEIKMTFNVTVDSGGYITYMDLSLFNLSDSTMSELSKMETKHSSPNIVLGGGYDIGQKGFNAFGIIFDGFIKNHIKTRRGADTVYRMLATTYRPRTMNLTLGKNTVLNNIIPVLAKQMDVTADFDPEQFKKDPAYPSGYNMQGDPDQIMRKLAKTHNFQWVNDRGRLYVYRADDKPPKKGSKGEIIIDVKKAMEGSPEITETGCVVTTRLNFEPTIGSKVKVVSSFAEVNYTGQYFTKFNETIYSKTYNVLKLEYMGDTHGDLWSTRITGTTSDVS